jgi:hypothetical protein
VNTILVARKINHSQFRFRMQLYRLGVREGRNGKFYLKIVEKLDFEVLHLVHTALDEHKFYKRMVRKYGTTEIYRGYKAGDHLTAADLVLITGMRLPVCLDYAREYSI